MTLATVSRYDSDAVSVETGHAVVVGGSMAGLIAARVVADAFDAVTVVEADEISDDQTARRGLPHGTQTHALLEAGRATLEDLFPGFGEDLLSAGGVLADGASDLNMFLDGDYLADGPTRMPAYSATRPLIEHVVRRHVAALDGVDVRTGRRVTGYRFDDEETAVTGVSLGGGGPGASTLAADLVVDATGRTSATPSWLDDHGYDSPQLDEVRIDLGYSTVAVTRPPSDRRAYFVPAAPPHTRGGAAIPVEDDRWLVNVHGMHGDHPPVDTDEFVRFAESLPTPELAELVETHAVRSDEADFYPFPSSRRYHYEGVDRFPDNLVVVGDALASFNPIYGQGMSVAALEVLALHHALEAEPDADLGDRYFDRAATLVDGPWLMAVGADAQFSATTGPTPRGTALFGWYLSRLARKAHADGALRAALVRVMGMEEPPTALIRPAILRRVASPSRSR